jgi:leucyl aminopeptidase (aminopeptidase T)
LNDDVTLFVEDGKVVDIKSKNKDYVDILNTMFSNVGSIEAYNIAEFGIGLNEMCSLTGNMLTDEGSYGTIHFGIGSNATIGGKSNVGFHLDFVIRNPTVIIDDLTLINEGDLVV